MDQEQHGFWVIWASFLAALVLAIIALPQWLMWARPEWLALTLIYWTIALPHRIGLLSALLLGICLDSLEGAVIGQNVFALMIMSLLSLVLYQRLRVYNLLQQAGTVFVLIGIHQLICQWVENFQGSGTRSLMFLLPAVSSALVWPVVFYTLRALRRHYRVS